MSDDLANLFLFEVDVRREVRPKYPFGVDTVKFWYMDLEKRGKNILAFFFIN